MAVNFRRLLALVAGIALMLLPLPSLLTSAFADVSTATPVPISTSCNGIIPTPGSENTVKKLIGGTLQPGGTAIFEISYPLDASDVGQTFTVDDCPVIGGDVKNAQAYEFTYVPNSAVFDVEFTLHIPAGTPLGTTYCNYAKTTGSPSASQKSNRKAGPACFTVGGNLRIDKHATGHPDTLLAGASFSVSCPTAAPTTPISEPPVLITGLTSGGAAVTATYNTAHHAWEASGVANPGSIGIAGPSGVNCTVTETQAPSGYLMPSPASHTYTIPVGTANEVVDWFNTAAAPSLHLAKSADPADGSTVTPGTRIDYTLDYYNDGNVDVTNATLTDAIPDHTTLVSGSISAGGSDDNGTITWTGLSVAKDTSAAHPAGSVSFSVTVDPDTAAGTTITNTGHLEATGVTGVDSNTTHHHVALISTLKSSDPTSGTQSHPAGVLPGGTIAYTISVSNPSDQPAQVTIADTVPAHTTYVADSANPAVPLVGSTLTWSNVTVPAKGSASVGFSVTVNAGAGDGDTITNTATVNGSDTNTTYHQVQLPHFTATKSAVPTAGSTADGATAVAPGDSIVYTIHVANDGSASGTAHVTDAIPAGTTYSDGTIDNSGTVDADGASWDATLDPGQSVDLHFTVTVDSSDANGTVIRNVATVAGTDTNATYHVVKFPHFTYSKSAVPAGGSSADQGTPVSRGDTITYTIHVANDGQKFGGVHVVDAVPANTTYSAGSVNSGGSYDAVANAVTWDLALAAGDSADLSFAVTVNGNAANGASIANSATVNDHPTNTVYHSVVVTSPPPPPVTSPLLHLAKSSVPASGSIVQVGDTIAYTINVTNTGDGAANAQTVTDTLPAGVTLVDGSAKPAPTSVNGQTLTWTVDVPAATGATPGAAAITYSVTVDPDVAPGSTLTNTATVAGLTATTDHHVATGDLTLVKRVAQSTAEYGDTLDYAFTATATGTADQHDVTVTDVVPDGTTYVDGSAACTDSGTCTTSYDAATRTVTWVLGDLAAGASRTLGFSVTIDVPDFDPVVGLPARTIHNTGIIGSDAVNPTPSNEVKTPLTAVLGVKVVRKPPTVKPESHSRLPFTGSLPVWPVSTVALMLIGAGIVLTSLRRRRES